jgi:predicted alpha/beta hydrolase family esterase
VPEKSLREIAPSESDVNQHEQDQSIANFPDMTNNRVLILPGLGNSGPDHWQTHWERAHPEFVRVTQENWDTPSADAWVERLHREIIASTTPAILIAHSLACCLVARWALTHSGPVVAALLVAPSDVEAPNYPTGTTGFAPMPLQPLPFRSLVVASTDDEYVPIARGKQFADAWQADYVLLGARGHIGSAAKLGMWPEGFTLLNKLRAA